MTTKILKGSIASPMMHVKLYSVDVAVVDIYNEALPEKCSKCSTMIGMITDSRL